MSVLKLKIYSGRPTNELTAAFETAGGPHSIAQRILNYINSLQTGSELAMSSANPPSIAISIQENEVQASGTITFSAHATAADTVIVNGVTLTGINAGPPANDEWVVGASATASATNLAASINASTDPLILNNLTATSALGVVTITSIAYGTNGNQATIAEGIDSGSVISVSGARLTGGAADATAQTLNF